MAWALWLSVPVLATVLAAVAGWWRGRGKRTADIEDGVRMHSAYLNALTAAPRGTARIEDKGL